MKQRRVESRPGTYRSALETERFAQGIRAQVPVLTVVGARPGPLAVIMAAQHGRELNGIAAIERVFESLRPADLVGTAVFLPVMNPVAVRMHAQDYPTEKPRYRPCGTTLNMNLNRCWRRGQGEPPPTHAAAIADAVWEQYMRHADVGIGLLKKPSRILRYGDRT